MSKNFKSLSKKEINLLKKVYNDKESGSWEKRASKLGELWGVSERTIRRWVSEKLKLKEKEDVLPIQYEEAKNKKLDTKKTKRFFITWAQNNTPVNKNMIQNMEAYSKHQNAEIVVVLGRYKNPTTVEENSKLLEWWDDSILPYASSNRHNIHKYLSIMADIRIQPTAVNPMTGLYGLSKENSCIFGHPKTQLEMIPVLDGYNPKMMMTTGSCTKNNYSDSKAGKKGEFHHTYGFVVVEIKDSEIFFTRQVTVNENGSFYDLFHYVNNEKIKEIDSIEGIVLGDLHYGEHDEKVLEKTHKLLNKLRPNIVVLHDVFDGKSISHHTIKDPFFQYGMEKRGDNDLEKEVENMLNGLKQFNRYKNVVVARSNHDEHLDKFLQNDWRKLPTPKNSIKYMEYSKILLEQYQNDNVIGIIPHLIKKRYPKFLTLNLNQSYRIGDIECGQHGQLGSNGSRGSVNQFRKLNTRIITAHTHTPSRKDGSVCVGTSTKLRLSYNKGASSWLQSHAIIHKDYKIQQIHFIGDEKEYCLM